MSVARVLGVVCVGWAAQVALSGRLGDEVYYDAWDDAHLEANSSSGSEHYPGYPECCECLAQSIPHERFNQEAAIIRMALDKEFPNKWWPTGGSLIAALRYGTNARQMHSGKINWVDNDIDLVVVSPLGQGVSTMKRLMAALPSNYIYDNHVKGDMIHIDDFPMQVWCPKDHRSGGGKMHLDIIFLFEDANGQLFNDPETDRNGGVSYFPTGVPLDDEGSKLLSVTDMILPFKKAMWAGGEINVPNHYLLAISVEDQEEYGKYGGWKELWKPDQMATDFCRCEPDDQDIQETRDSIQKLTEMGYASFGALLDEPEASEDIVLIKRYQRMEFQKLPKCVVIETEYGKFLVAEPDGRVHGDGAQIGPSEQFTTTTNESDWTVTFTSNLGKLLLADKSGKLTAKESGDAAGWPAAKFKLVRSGSERRAGVYKLSIPGMGLEKDSYVFFREDGSIVVKDGREDPRPLYEQGNGETTMFALFACGAPPPSADIFPGPKAAKKKREKGGREKVKKS